MKHLFLPLILLATVLSSGCSEKISNAIENNENLGMNAPVVGGTLIDIPEEEDIVINTTTTTTTAAPDAKAMLIDDTIAGMTIEEKIGQLILGCVSSDPVGDMEKYHLGGYVFFADSFKNSSPEDFARLIAQISSKNDVTPFYSADEEGGEIVRVSKYKQFRDEPFSSPQSLYRRGGADLLKSDTQEKAELLTSIGINLNLAPVADISISEDSYIYSRTIGEGAELTSEAVCAIVTTAADNGLATCLKHFPGYGDNVDTHKGTAHDDRELYEFYNRDFKVYSDAIDATGEMQPMVMVGHTVYDGIDPDNPASLSKAVHTQLREKVGFSGVCVTDALNMDAISKIDIEGSVYVAAFKAGNDMLLAADIPAAYNDLYAAWESGEITEEEIDTSLRRIITMKVMYGIVK
ncbi:MAG: beta-hexosaminidase [Oscillospiraceae bacterium]|nr:beta-hexosaminidase [Oscillospiraceae bacterium]